MALWTVLGALGLAVAAAVAAQPPLDTITVAPRPFAQSVAVEATVEAVRQATLTGMLISLAAVYRPAWVATFRADRYFR